MEPCGSLTHKRFTMWLERNVKLLGKKEQCVVFFLNKLTKKEMIKNHLIKNQVNNADN